MSVYAVYARAPQSTLWSRREVCATKEEADRIASAAVDGSAAGERPAAASSVVVEWEDGTNVPAELAAQWDRRLATIKRLAETAHAENEKRPS